MTIKIIDTLVHAKRYEITQFWENVTVSRGVNKKLTLHKELKYKYLQWKLKACGLCQ
jgi:hypothetical protein